MTISHRSRFHRAAMVGGWILGFLILMVLSVPSSAQNRTGRPFKMLVWSQPIGKIMALRISEDGAPGDPTVLFSIPGSDVPDRTLAMGKLHASSDGRVVSFFYGINDFGPATRFSLVALVFDEGGVVRKVVQQRLDNFRLDDGGEQLQVLTFTALRPASL